MDYAICPNCKAGWKLLEDALKCCSEIPIDELEEDKLRSMQRVIKSFPRKPFAIISEHRYTAERWRLEHKIKKDQAIWVTEDNYMSIGDEYNIVFAGSRKSYLGLPFMYHFTRELQRQESERNFRSYMLYQDEGGPNGTPMTMLFPIDTPEQVDHYKKTLPKDRVNPSTTMLTQTFHSNSLVYTPQNTEHNPQP